MTRSLPKSKKHRPNVTSHFKVAEVQMEALNDPLPPHHPGSPKESIIPFVALDFSKQQSISQPPMTAMDTHSSKLSTLDNNSEVTYPSVTNGISNFL